MSDIPDATVTFILAVICFACFCAVGLVTWIGKRAERRDVEALDAAVEAEKWWPFADDEGEPYEPEPTLRERLLIPNYRNLRPGHYQCFDALYAEELALVCSDCRTALEAA